VSGEPVVILPGEAMGRLVAAAAKIAGSQLGRYAIIGGVAVSARLGQAHRSTADLDAVVDDATPPPAIAMKLHAIEDRRPSGGIDKRASDAWDMYRIFLDLDRGGAVRSELGRLPQPLRRVVGQALQRIFIERAGRTSSWLRSGDDRMAAVNPEELAVLAQPAIRTILQP
jgi:hypothetical protein